MAADDRVEGWDILELQGLLEAESRLCLKPNAGPDSSPPRSCLSAPLLVPPGKHLLYHLLTHKSHLGVQFEGTRLKTLIPHDAMV